MNTCYQNLSTCKKQSYNTAEAGRKTVEAVGETGKILAGGSFVGKRKS